MSEQPLTRAVLASVLADFHRDILRPDIKQIVGEEVGALRHEMFTHFDAVYQGFERLETEYQAVKAGLGRVEERLDAVEARLERVETRLGHLEVEVLELRTRLARVEERLEELIALEEKYPLRAEVQDLKARVDLLHEDIRRLEDRLKA